MRAQIHDAPRRPTRWDALAPPSLLIFFWITDLLIPYVYAVLQRPWERQTGVMGMIEVGDVHLAMVAALLYLVFWFAGYYGIRWTPRASLLIRAPIRNLSALHLTANFGAALAVFIVLYAVNPNTAFVSRMELTVGPWGKALFLAIGVLFAAFWLSAAGLLQTGGRALPLWRVVLVLSLALTLIIAFAPMEGRARMLIALLYMVVVWHYFVQRLSTAVCWGVLAAGLIVALGLDYFRLRQEYSQIDVLEMSYGLAYGRQFDGVLNLAAVLRAISVDYTQHHYGAAWMADLLNDIGVQTNQLSSRAAFMTEAQRMPRFTAGFPLTRPGEFFFAFGWPGIVIGAAILGAVTRVWYNWMMARRPFGPASAPVYFTFLMTAGLVTQKNYLFSSLVMAAVYSALILGLALTLYGYRLARTRPLLRWPVAQAE
ncbi:MAG TPA: hypothetical protein VEF55_12675 [Candidatus Binatia bacterium]|nr:hypothetical protein [Candidatus Binatia bacterium]